MFIQTELIIREFHLVGEDSFTPIELPEIALDIGIQIVGLSIIRKRWHRPLILRIMNTDKIVVALQHQ
jgi:hypothetical protein